MTTEVNVTPRTPVRLLGQDADGVFPVENAASRGLLYPDGLAGEVAESSASWLGGLTGEQPLSVEGMLGQRVSILNFIPEAEHAAIRAGTSTTDLTAYIQAAIDRVSADLYYSVLWFPRGRYVTDQLTAKDSCILLSDAQESRLHSGNAPRLVLKPGSVAASMFTSAGTVSGFGVVGLYIIGLSATTNVACIDLAGATSSWFARLRVESFGSAVIRFAAGVESRIVNVYTPNCNRYASHAAEVGTIDIGGTEHRVSHCEIVAGQGAVGSGSNISANLRNVGIVCRGSACDFNSIISEFGDIAWLFTGSGQGKNTVSNCVGDNTTAHGMVIEAGSTQNRFFGFRAHRCGHNADATYYGIWAKGGGNAFFGCLVTGQGDANRLQDGFFDDTSSNFDETANQWYGCISYEHRRRGITNNVGSRRCGYDAPIKNPVQRTVTGSAQTVSMSQLGFLRLTAAGAASVSTFSDGIAGQRALIDFVDANVTLTHGTNLVCPGATNVTGSTSVLYEAVCKDGTKWLLRQIG